MTLHVSLPLTHRHDGPAVRTWQNLGPGPPAAAVCNMAKDKGFGLQFSHLKIEIRGL